LWSLVNPLLMTLVFYIVFAVLLPPSVPANCKTALPAGATDDLIQAARQCKISNNFAVFLFIGILSWNFTSGAVTYGMNSLLNNSSIAKKVYFPREVLPMSAVLAQLVNYLLALIPLAAVMVFTGVIPSGYVFLLPVFIFFQTLFLLGLALILSQVILSFRDLSIIMEVLLQAWFFLTPVFYSMQQVFKEGAQLVYWLNPMASFIESYRTILFFDYSPDLLFTLRTCFYGLATFVIGYAFFMWKRKRIGELL
jgi:lipopolysaccharide transport system permease protein